jgi:hypothetical protein
MINDVHVISFVDYCKISKVKELTEAYHKRVYDRHLQPLELELLLSKHEVVRGGVVEFGVPVFYPSDW